MFQKVPLQDHVKHKTNILALASLAHPGIVYWMLDNVNKNRWESTTPIFFSTWTVKRVRKSISSQFESFALSVKADECDF